MSRKTLVIVIVLAIIALSAIGLGIATNYYANLPENLSQHETIVLGQSRFVPGSEAAIRVLVRDTSDAEPLPGATIRVSMKPADGGQDVPLFEGQTGDLGTADVRFFVDAGTPFAGGTASEVLTTATIVNDTTIRHVEVLTAPPEWDDTRRRGAWPRRQRLCRRCHRPP